MSNSNVHTAQGLTAWRQLIKKEYYESDNRQDKHIPQKSAAERLEPIAYPVIRKQHPYALVYQNDSRAVLEKCRKIIELNAQNAKPSMKEYLTQKFYRFDGKHTGRITWPELLLLLRSDFKMTLTSLESVLLQQALKVSSDGKPVVNYNKFIQLIITPQKVIDEKQNTTVTSSQMYTDICNDRINIRKERNDKERVIEFLRKVLRKLSILSVQQNKTSDQILKEMFTMINLQGEVNQADFFVTLHAVLGHQTQLNERNILFEKLLEAIPNDSRQNMNYLKFLQILKAYGFSTSSISSTSSITSQVDSKTNLSFKRS